MRMNERPNPNAMVTATMVKDLYLCERRAHLDVHGDPTLRGEVSDFVQMLWEGGLEHEDRVVETLLGDVVDLRGTPPGDLARATTAAMVESPDWIVGGCLEIGDRVGVPDLLRREGAVWIAGDAKSGAALDAKGRPNREYALQVGFYASMLVDLEVGDSDRAFIIDRNGAIVEYDLRGAFDRNGSIIDEVARFVTKARGVVAGEVATRPALSSVCAMCVWRVVCREELDAANDLTLISGLGRALRPVVEPYAATITDLAALDLDALRDVPLPGLGRERLKRFRDRARLLATPGSSAFARAPLDLPHHARELHLDLESDPLDDGLVYLHGVTERTSEGSHYQAFFAEDREREGEAFARTWAFLHSDPPGHVYCYSRFERTNYRSLQARYPDVCTADEVEALFARERTTDLLVDIVQPLTEWPTNGVGIKALAKFLGFSWRDRDASGAASIAWWREYCATGSTAVRRRIEEYNDDDTVATAVLLDALRLLPVLSEAPWSAARTG